MMNATATALLAMASNCTLATTENLPAMRPADIIASYRRTFWADDVTPVTRKPRIHAATSTSLRMAAVYAGRGYTVHVFRQTVVICPLSIDD
jgi:hypothetical protein